MSNKGAIDLVVSTEAFKQINLLKDELTAINTQIQNISQISLSGKSGNGSGSTKTIKDNTKNVNELSLAYQKLTQKEKELLQWHNKLETTQKSLNNQRTKEVSNTEKQASAFTKLNAELSKATKQYQDFQAKKAQGIALSAKEQGQLNSLIPRLEMLSKAYKMVGNDVMRTTGMTTRARSSFDSLGFSVAQMTREAPAFLNSMQTGFMALTNNIPIFVDEITKLKEANVQLAASGKPTVNVFKQVAAALFSWQSAISAAIVVLTVLGPKLVDYISVMTKVVKVTDGAKKAQEEYNNTLREGENAAALEITRLSLLSKALEDSNTSYEDKKKIINELRDTYGEHLQNMSDEELLTSGLKSVYDVLTNSIKEYNTVKAASDELSDIYNKRIEEEVKIRTAKLAVTEAEAKAEELKNKSVLDGLAPAASSLVYLYQRATLARKVKENQDQQVESQNTLNALEKEEVIILDILTENTNKYLKALGLKNDELKTEKEIRQGTVGWYEQQIAFIEKTIKLQTDPLAIKALKGHAEAYRQILITLGAIENKEKNRAKDKPMDETKIIETAQAVGGLIEELEKESKALGDVQKNTKDAFQIKEIEKARKAISELITALKSGNFSNIEMGGEALENMLQQLEVSDPLMANMIRNQIRIAEEMDNMAKATEGATENIMTFNDWLMVYGDTAMAFSDMTNAIYERQIQNIEDELDALDDSYNHKKELLELEVGDEEAKNERLRQLEIEKFQEEQKMQKKLAEARKKQAIIDKAAALFNIAINTLVAVSRAPAEAGPFLGIYLATWLKIQGALAAAAVLAQPVPKYKEGHLSGTHEGAAIVGDGGRSEVIQRKDGTFALTPNKSTLTYMKRGDKVHKSIDSFIDTLPQKSILSAANNAAMFASLSSDLLPKKEAFDNSFKEQLKEEIVKSLSGIKIYNNDRAVGDAVAQALKDNMYRNKFL